MYYWPTKQKFTDKKILRIAGAEPSWRQAEKDTMLSGKLNNPGPFFLYILIEKRGQLFSHTNNPPYTGFHVNPRWITNFLQRGKITIEVARKDAPE